MNTFTQIRKDPRHIIATTERGCEVGQRIDHFIVEKSLVDSSKGLKVKDFKTLQSLGAFRGTSNHCPCGVSSEEMNLILNSSTLCSLVLEGQPTDCLLDSGSCFSIFNPEEGTKEETSNT